MPRVTIVMPVYNAMEHLAECVDSILAQSYADFELLCVDDGSTDSSLAMLDAYAKKDDRVRILQQPHKNAGAARNAGIELAKGDYLLFWDADDTFEPSAIESMLSKCEEDSADICVCGANKYYESIGKTVRSNTYIQSAFLPEALPFSRQSNEPYIMNFTVEAAWNKMFKREFVESHGLRFQELPTGDDIFFVECALCLATRITVVPENLMCYRTMKNQGLVASMAKSPLYPLQAWVDTREELEKHGCLPVDSYARKTASAICYVLRNTDNWAAFKEAVSFLQHGGLAALGHAELRPTDFYMSAAHREILEQLMSLSAEEFAVYLAHSNYQTSRNRAAERHIAQTRVTALKQKNQLLSNRNEALHQKLDRLRDSNDKLRCGNALLKEKLQRVRSQRDGLKEELAEIKKSPVYRAFKTIGIIK